jgi:ribosomal-protein-alanine N-acetyltransferase
VNAKQIPELETERLLLRPIRMSDSDAFLAIFSDARTMEYWSREPIDNLEEAETLVQQELEWVSAGSCINWGVALQESAQLIGKVVLFNFSEQNHRAEVGYILDRRYWGKGYMSETLACVLAYAFSELELHRIEADTDPENLASLALLERFGFAREGLFRDRWLVHGKWHDSAMYGLLEKDYVSQVRPTGPGPVQPVG